MEEKELIRKQGEHLAEILDALDGDGKRFEFGTLYYYIQKETKKDSKGNERSFYDIKTVEPQYGVLSLRKKSSYSTPEYALGHGKHISTNELYREPKKAVKMALYQVGKNRERVLEQIQSEVLQVLNRFESEIKYYDGMKALIEEKLSTF